MLPATASETNVSGVKPAPNALPSTTASSTTTEKPVSRTAVPFPSASTVIVTGTSMSEKSAVSVPSPPISVSLPRPPVRMSSPPLPLRTLSTWLPVRTSSPAAEPVTFSKLENISASAPLITTVPEPVSSSVTSVPTGVAVRSSVSVPVPPSISSAPPKE